MLQADALTNAPETAKERGENQDIGQALAAFKVIDNPYERWIIRISLLLIVIYALMVDGLPFSPSWPHPEKVHLLSAALYIGLMVIFFLRLLDQVPAVLATLWDRGVLLSKSADKSVEAAYVQFVKDFHVRLNAHWGWWLGAALLIYGCVAGPLYPPGVELVKLSRGVGLTPFDMFEFFSGVLRFVITGWIAWRILIIGYMISRIPRRFRLAVQPSHPDSSGGLRPLGSLCLSQVLILLPAALYYAAWLVFAERASPATAKLYQINPAIIDWQGPLGIVLIASLIAFFLPIYRIHREMVYQGAIYQKRLDHLGKQIDTVAQELLDSERTRDPKEAQARLDSLKWMQNVYQASKDFPTWPFDLNIILRLTAAEIVPLLSLTGIGKPILELIGNVMGLLLPR